ncbi:hypothetical protein [Paenibacillus ihuae]|uniref:hypothetical protein n=1 Tax=Paenibacillus ihuae TaxID=1232431 RepID=UPI0006D5784C|nr:hypothetical protein [Paenibacillus ihuae]
MLHNVIKFLGICVTVVGLIVGVFAGAGNSIVSMLIIFAGAITFGLLIIGFGELLHSVHRIEMKIAGERPQVLNPLSGNSSSYSDKGDNSQ